MPNFFQRKWKELTLFLLVTIIVMFGAVELALRFAYPEQLLLQYQGVRSREYHHILPPNVKMFQGTFEGKNAVVMTNEDGLRTKYSREEFRKHRNRLIFLGDSFTFGWRLRQEAAFPEMVEQMLRERLPQADVAVVNAGIISHSPMLENLLLRGVLSNYEPTFVAIMLDASDFGDDIQYAKEAKEEDGQVVFKFAASQSSVRYYGATVELVGHVMKRVFNYNPDEYDYTQFQLTIGGKVERNRYFIYRYPIDSTRQYCERTLKHIAAAAEFSEKVGAKFALFVAPRYQHWNAKEAPRNWEKSCYAIPEPYQFEYLKFFDEQKDSVSFPIVNLLPAFQATREFPLVFEDDAHWNERGSAFVAKLVADYLVEQNVVSR